MCIRSFYDADGRCSFCDTNDRCIRKYGTCLDSLMLILDALEKVYVFSLMLLYILMVDALNNM